MKFVPDIYGHALTSYKNTDIERSKFQSWYIGLSMC